ncbi:MAG: DUF3618 domain-containing protein [Gemmatimonadales bacterium]|nr:MAG: DUF3618 domain-containing protein [Gemmatimonadales bacterium]
MKDDTMRENTMRNDMERESTRGGVVRDGVVQEGSTRREPVRRDMDRDRDPAEIRQDIRRTRGEMDETVDQLVDRFSVGSLVDEVWHRVRQRSGGGPDVGGILREHPVPIALMGLGLGWLAVEQASGRSVSTPGAGSSSGSRQSGTDFHRARGGKSGQDHGRSQGQGNGHQESDGAGNGEDFTDRISDKASEAMSTAREKTESMREKTDSMKESTKEAGIRAREGFREMLAESPLTIGSIVFGLGLASGLAVPSSEYEDRKMGGMSDQLKDEAGKIGSQAAGRAGEVGRTAMGAAIAEARDQVDDVGEDESGSAGTRDEHTSGRSDQAGEMGRTGF